MVVAADVDGRDNAEQRFADVERGLVLCGRGAGSAATKSGSKTNGEKSSEEPPESCSAGNQYLQFTGGRSVARKSAFENSNPLPEKQLLFFLEISLSLYLDLGKRQDGAPGGRAPETRRRVEGSEDKHVFQFGKNSLTVVAAGKDAIVLHATVGAHVCFDDQRIVAFPIPSSKGVNCNSGGV